MSVASNPGPLIEGEEKGYRREESEKAFAAGFLGVIGACACSRYQALFPPPFGPGYEASMLAADRTNSFMKLIVLGI